MSLDGLTLQHGNFYYEKTEFVFNGRSMISPGGTVTIWSSGESPILFSSIWNVALIFVKNNPSHKLTFHTLNFRLNCNDIILFSGLGISPSFPERKVLRAPHTWTALTIPDGLVITTLIRHGKV